MRVLMVEDDLHPYAGQERSQFANARALAARGHEIDLIYRAPGELLAEYQTFCHSLRRAPGHLLDLRTPLRSSVSWLRTTALAVRSRYDIVYINQYQDAPFGAAVSTLERIPLVCHLRQPPPSGVGIQWPVARSRVSRCVAVSFHTRAQYVGHGMPAERIEVVHNGIDLDVFHPDRSRGMSWRRSHGIEDDEFLVLYVGRLDPEKGIETLLDAHARMDLSPRACRLVLAGGPRNHQQESTAEAYVASLQARSDPRRCFWLGWCSDTTALYQAADVLVLPSRTDEPLGRVTLEAMSCKCPAIASRVGGTPEVLFGPFERFLIPPGDPETLAAALLAMRDWRTREPELGAACREHVRTHFALERTVDGIERILTQAIDDRTHRHD